MPTEKFEINVPEPVLDDLRARLRRTRWPDEVQGAGWRYGADLTYMQELTAYWLDRYDWRLQERHLNTFPNFRLDVDGLRIHFIHARGKGPNPIPLLITHGWPSSFDEMLKLIPLLRDPVPHGADPADSFDVIVPSVPGYGFSDRPLQPGMTRGQVAHLWLKLMHALGYPRFALHANDIGAVISSWLALDHPESVIALHTMMPGFPSPAFAPGEPPMSQAEKDFAALSESWDRDEGGYNLIQETRPQTLGYGLNDSPVGLMAWIIEKWRAWTAPDAELDHFFSKDELLTNVMVYWVTETANSAARSYFERAHDPRRLPPDDRIRVPTGVALTTEANQHAPREWVERRYTDIRRWTEFPRGGHFMAAEQPELLAAELREFFRQFR